jgi:hypothetical protein
VRLDPPPREASTGNDIVPIAAVALGFVDTHQAIRMGHWQRLEQHRIDYREQCDIRADA